jgi:methionyl aminopeptidase
MTNILSKDEIAILKSCGRKLAESLEVVLSHVVPGVSTLELDAIAEAEIRRRGMVPSFKNYQVGDLIYPATLCTSINDEVVHGIPSKRKIADGDLVSIDTGAGLSGIFTDMAKTVVVGNASAEVENLVRVTEESLYKGIEQAKVGNRIGDIGEAVQKYAENDNFGVIRDFVGHGIGRKPHLAPQIPNFGRKGTGTKIVEGMALCIEPMVSLHDYRVIMGTDGWTVRTWDSSPTAHFEHTIIVENGLPVIVTTTERKKMYYL